MNRKYFLPLIFLFCIQALWAQTPERSRKEIPLITNVIATIDEAQGWMLQNNGEWVSAQNKIPFKNYEQNKRKSDKYQLGQENFDRINFRSITINNTVYSVLLIYAQDGKYEFPVLGEKWNQYKTLTYYVFKESKWSRIFPDSTVFNHPHAVNTELVVHGDINNYKEDSYLFEIENKARQAIYQQTESNTNLIFAAYPVKIRDKKFFRFKLYETINKREIYIKYLLPYNRDKLFKTYYYETAFEAFAGFVDKIALIKPEKLNDPGYYLHFMNRGKSKFNEQQYRTALQLFVKASMVNPPDSAMISILFWKGKSKLKLNSAMEALEDFNTVINRKPQSMVAKKVWLLAHYERGNAYYAVHEYANACEDWNFALQNGISEAYNKIRRNCDKRSAGMMKPIDIEKSEKLFERAMRKYDDARYLKALHLFEKSWQNNYLTQDFRLPLYTGLCRYKLGDFVRSVDEFDRAAALEPESFSKDYDTWTQVFVMRGKAWHQMGYPNKACENWYRAKLLGNIDGEALLVIHCDDFEPETKITHDSVEATLEAGIKFCDEGDYAKALEILSQISLEDENPEAILLYSYLGNAHHQTGDYAAAVADFTKVIETDPGNATWLDYRVAAHFNRGISKFKSGDTQGACSDWRKAMELGLKDPDALDYIYAHCHNK